jgi:UDP-galactose transporter B1
MPSARLLHLLVCVGGIWTTYTAYSLVQEEMSATLFAGERFTQMQSSLLVQCLFNCAVAVMCVALWDAESVFDAKHRIARHAGIGLSYVLAMLLSNIALTYVRYHEQVLAKSSKPIFVLLVARVAGVRRFPLFKYCVVLCITLGGALFMLDSQPVQVGGPSGPNDLLWGRLLVLVSLVLDGVTALQQDILAQSHTVHTSESESARPSSFRLMLHVNVWASVFLCVSSIATGELFDFVRLVLESHELLLLVIAFATCSCIGQLFIFSTIRHHGALLCSMVTTTRKFSTVMLSVLLFGHGVTPVQVLGVVLLFGALFVDVWVDHTK